MTVYNVEAANVPITVTRGDSITLTFSVTLNDVLYNMTGMQLDIKVVNPDGTTYRSWSSAGVSPKITISTSQFTITDVPITAISTYKYDVQLTNAGNIKTIQRGSITVVEDIT